MKFVDEVSVEVRAGNGGAGCVSFRREKYIPRGGPNGGDGGRGGHVVALASTRKNTLMDLYLRKRLLAENGKPGMGSNMHGRNGKDIVIEVPVGTLIRDEAGHVLADMDRDGMRYLLAKGGNGGLGNSHFATSTHQTPRYAQPGEEGEAGIRLVELKVMADVGLVGLPNAGKSTLLTKISNARPKVADYPFTTLKPVLGEVFVGDTDAFVVADIPGLIAGAHEGKGLGDRFLRHVERTKLLLHLVDAVDPGGLDITDQLHEVEAELKGYGETVWNKPRMLVVNKTDALNPELLAEAKKQAKATGLPAFYISAVSGDGVEELMHEVYRHLQAMREEAA
ncbi:MAG TPA: GTPase ObgE [Mariprofundaceae bacterium]|nr:GTPase ObgE [Mariprofundaceae bacterium]